MKAWLCTTLVNFFGPMQGPARLYAYLKNQGYDVALKDLNQNIYFDLLSKENLKETLEKYKGAIFTISRDKFLRKNVGSILINNSNGLLKKLLASNIFMNSSGHDFVKNNELFKKIALPVIGSKINSDNIIYALLSNQKFIISEIDKAGRILDKNWLSLPTDEFLRNFQILLCGKAIIDMVHFPAQLDFGLGFEGTEYRPHAKDILHAVKDEHHNFLIPYFKNKVMSEFEKEQPKIVGISITHTSEFIPAFTLAATIKSKYPQTHISLGGATATELVHRIQKNPALWNLFDSLIAGPGEYAFGELIEAVEKNKNLSNIPNLVYKEGGVIKTSRKSREFDLNEACTPEFVSVRPKSILPLETSSGCYWGKCMFCYYPKSGLADINKTGNKRERKMELVLEDIKKYRDSYDPLYIGFTDSALSPSRIKQIAEYNLNTDRPVSFSSFFRFEKDFKSRDFCEKISAGGFLGGQVGLESGSQRVNNIINKGVDIEDAKVILKNFYDVGILVHLYTIVGIPGEKLEDALMTLNFLKKYRKFLTLDWQIYPLRVLEYSPIILRSKEFGLKAEPLPDSFLAQVMKYDLAEGLSQNESTSLSIKFCEKLKNRANPLSKFMDIESYKAVILGKKVKDNF